ncbi:MAG: hypothetical protein Q9212_005101 [Teloschistes hypoglaucus]
MAALELYMKKAYNHEPKHPSQLPEGRFFPDTPEAPELVRGRVNHIILYHGSFNPPHQGHMSLLRHTFEHGVHDLNVIGAFVRPLVDEYSLKKAQIAGGSFAFDRESRCMLWKKDPRFPDWAWVHEGNGSLGDFLARLQEVASEDGFGIDYLSLKGPWENEHLVPWKPDRFCYGSTMLIISDAARAANYQRSSGKIRDFEGYNKWRGLLTLNASMAVDTKDGDDENWSIEANDGDHSASGSDISVDPDTHQDMKNIVQCRRSEFRHQQYQIRFVKTRKNNQVKHSTDTSSTELRDIMSRNGRPVDIESTLKDLALSGDLLWECRQQWLDKAKLRTNRLISLQLPDGWNRERHQMKEENRAKTEMSKDEDAIITEEKDQDLEKEHRESMKKRKRASSEPVGGFSSPFKRVKRMEGEEDVVMEEG